MTGIRKVFEICIEDCETVRAVYNRQCPHLISVTPAFLLEVINSTFLDKKLAEVTLTAGSSSFELKSYVDEGAGTSGCRFSVSFYSLLCCVSNAVLFALCQSLSLCCLSISLSPCQRSILLTL